MNISDQRIFVCERPKVESRQVSVFITTFNRPSFLHAAIESVLTQSFQDFELWVLDNNSEVSTKNVIGCFADPRLGYVRHKDISISEQRNLGISLANGEFLCFLDDDDIWLRNKLELQLAEFRNNNDGPALVYGGFRYFGSDPRANTLYVPNLRGWVLDDLLAVDNVFTGSASNPMIRLSALKTIGGYDEKVLVGEDWEAYLRIAESFPIAFVTAEVLMIRSHASGRLGQRTRDALRTERKVYVRYSSKMLPPIKSRWLLRMSGKYIRVGDRCRGRKLVRCRIVSKTFPLFSLFIWVVGWFPLKAITYAFQGFDFWRKKYRDGVGI